MGSIHHLWCGIDWQQQSEEAALAAGCLPALRSDGSAGDAAFSNDIGGIKLHAANAFQKGQSKAMASKRFVQCPGCFY